MKTLLVSNDVSWAKQTQGALAALGVDADLLVWESDDFRASVEKNDWDVVMVDLESIQFGAYELVDVLKDKAPLTEIIAVYSDYVPNEIINPIRSGVSDYLNKYGAPKRLADKVREAAGKKMKNVKRMEALRQKKQDAGRVEH